MNETKQKYLEHKKIAELHFGGYIDEVDNYVKELENQNEEMIKALIMIYEAWHEDSILISSVKPIIEKVTNKNIEEVIT